MPSHLWEGSPTSISGRLARLPPGLPLLVKDLGLAVNGYPLTNGSAYSATYTPTTDAPLVTRLQEIGLYHWQNKYERVGLTPTTESRYLGVCHNPWNSDYSAGGSSGVLPWRWRCIVPIAHATDGGEYPYPRGLWCGWLYAVLWGHAVRQHH